MDPGECGPGAVGVDLTAQSPSELGVGTKKILMALVPGSASRAGAYPETASGCQAQVVGLLSGRRERGRVSFRAWPDLSSRSLPECSPVEGLGV